MLSRFSFAARTRGAAWVWGLAACWALVAPPARAEEPAPTQPAAPAAKKSANDRFTRVTRAAAGEPESLQTALVRYRADGKDDLVVDLIGVVHIGDKAYYEKLNKVFESYDALLYELVAPEGARPEKGVSNADGSLLTSAQTGMKSLLALEFQLDVIDYTKENFVHADFSPEEFAESMKNRKESFLKLFFRMLGQSAAQQSGKQQASDIDLLMALFSRDRALRLKRVMAEQFTDIEAASALFNGPDGSTILTERNKRAIDVLKKQLEAGKKRVAIFYGAAHMPDLETRLEKEFALKPTETEWFTAWDLSPKK